MGNIVGVPIQVALVVSVLVVIVGCVMVTLERIDQRTEMLAQRSESNRRKHDILGWTPEDLTRVQSAWAFLDPKSLYLPRPHLAATQHKALGESENA